MRRRTSAPAKGTGASGASALSSESERLIEIAKPACLAISWLSPSCLIGRHRTFSHASEPRKGMISNDDDRPRHGEGRGGSNLKSTGPRGPWGFESLALRHSFRKLRGAVLDRISVQTTPLTSNLPRASRIGERAMIVDAAKGKGPPRQGYQRVMLTAPRVLGTVCENRLRRRPRLCCTS